MSKAYVQALIAKTETKLVETKESLVGQRSPVTDALKVVLPMMEDQLSILKSIADSLPE